jgi:hypothetical protein
MNLRTLLLSCCCVASVGLPVVAQPSVVVVLPFENLSASQVAAVEIRQRIAAALTKKGWTVVAGDEVEAVLEKNRIRYLDTLDDASRAAVLDATHATAYVTGAVYDYESGENPFVGFAVRMVRSDGTVAWADVTAAAAADTERPFGFGRATHPEEVADAAFARLVRRMPAAGEEPRLLRGASKPPFRTAPATFRDASIDPRSPHLVCVLPLDNRSGSQQAPRIVSEILAIRLAAAEGFEVVDPAKMRSAALAAHIASFQHATIAQLAAMSPLVGTPLFLRGTVYEFREIGGRGNVDPSIQLELTLHDLSAGRIVWSAQHERKGSDYEGLLLLGAASNAVLLTDRVVTEMIDAESHSTPRGGSYAAAQKRTPGRHSELHDSRKDGHH